MTDSTVPRPALLLGLAGLLPSVAMVVAMLALPDWRAGVARAGIAYGAVIVSFIGGAWWGLVCARAPAAPGARMLVLTVLPSLIAWPAVLLPAPTGLAVLALTFAVLLPTDARLQREGVAPPWWMALRRILSPGMAALHAAGAAVLLLSPG
jgi:hypothetical protein